MLYNEHEGLQMGFSVKLVVVAARRGDQLLLLSCVRPFP